MEIKDFTHLPNIEKSDNSRRFELAEKARAILPCGSKYGIFDVYVARINKDKKVVLSMKLCEDDPSLIDHPIAINPKYIKIYQSLN